jgi:hypothetical protein
MHTKEPRPDPLTDLGYETRDVNYRGVGIASLIFFGFLFAMLGIAWLYLAIFEPHVLRFDQQQMPITGQRTPQAPPGRMLENTPVLQSNTTVRTDIRFMRLEEERRLNSTGWVDREVGVAHIPIDRAKEMVLRQGRLPGGGIRLPAGGPAPATGAAEQPGSPAQPGLGQPGQGQPGPGQLGQGQLGQGQPGQGPQQGVQDGPGGGLPQ